MDFKCVGGCVLALVAAACSGGSGVSGGSGGSSSGGTTPKTVDEGAAVLASSMCDTFSRCGDAFISILYGTVENCRARETAQVKAQYSLAGTNATGDQLARCGADVAAQSCADALYGDSPASCELPGIKANGDACGTSGQCSSQYCKVVSGTCGTCAAQASAGAACTVASDCGRGLTCDSGMHCVAVTRLSAGSNCDTTSATTRCGGGSSCRTATGSTMGTCQNPLGANAACMTGDHCDTSQGLLCDATAMMCKAIAYADVNQPCGTVNGVATRCRGNGLCTGTPNKTCQATAADGATCNTTSGPNCQYPASCNSNNVCVLVNTCS